MQPTEHEGTTPHTTTGQLKPGPPLTGLPITGQPVSGQSISGQTVPARPTTMQGSALHPPATPTDHPAASPTDHPPAHSAPHSAQGSRANATPAYFGEALADAERLMKYAAEIGVDVEPEIRAAILHARAVNEWTEDTVEKLLDALTRLAVRLRPVTAQTLKSCESDAATVGTVKRYYMIAIVLAVIIVPASIATFVSSALSAALAKDVVTANDLAVKLRSQLHVSPPPAAPGAPAANGPLLPAGADEAEVIAELQLFASTNRGIYDRTRELNHLVLPHEAVPLRDTLQNESKRRAAFEITPGIPDIYADRDRLIGSYQDVRNFAQIVLNNASVFYGAIAACILPVLYALLGTCAYLLRSFEDQMSSRTFSPSAANSARFLIAGIGGAVVGLFNNLTVSAQATIPPLALAFLVGYAVDVFFTFLESVIRTFSRSTPLEAPTQPAKPRVAV